MNKYDLSKFQKSPQEKKDDLAIGRELLSDIQYFLKIKKDLKTKKHRAKQERGTRKR